MGTKKKMKIIKYIVAFTLSAVVSLTSINRAVSKTSVSRDLAEETRSGATGISSKRRQRIRRAKQLEERRRNYEKARAKKFNKAVFDSNTASACKWFTNGSMWNRNWAYFTCVDSYQENEEQTIDMNNFVGNTNGKLVKGSGYWDSCSGTSLTKAGVLHATCEDKKGDSVKTSIDIKTLLSWQGNYLSRS